MPARTNTMGKMTAILLCNMSAVRASLLGGWRSQSCPERCVLPHQPVNHDTGRCQLPPQHLYLRVVGPRIVVDLVSCWSRNGAVAEHNVLHDSVSLSLFPPRGVRYRARSHCRALWGAPT